MSSSESDVYQRLVHRITRLIISLGLLGGAVLALVRGLRFGLGFLLGASLSYVSFWRWKALTDSLGGTPKRRSVWLWLLRFGALIGGGYAIVKYLEVTPVAVFFGLLISGAAVVIAVIYELIFIRS